MIDVLFFFIGFYFLGWNFYKKKKIKIKKFCNCWENEIV